MRREAIRPNSVLVSLLLATLIAWLGLDSVSVSPNRIVPGRGVDVLGVAGWSGVAASIAPMFVVLGLAWRPTPGRLRWATGLVVLMLSALPVWLVVAAALRVDPDMPQARMGSAGASGWRCSCCCWHSSSCAPGWHCPACWAGHCCSFPWRASLPASR
nr:hypothetical protein [Halomonas elongata]